MRSSSAATRPPKADDVAIPSQKSEHGSLSRSASGSGLAAVRSASTAAAAVGAAGTTSDATSSTKDAHRARATSRSSSKGQGPSSARPSRHPSRGPDSASSSVDGSRGDGATGGQDKGQGDGTEGASALAPAQPSTGIVPEALMIIEPLPDPPELSPSLLDLPTLLAGSGQDSHGRPRSPTTAIAAAFASLQDAHGQLKAAYVQCVSMYRDAKGRYASLAARLQAASAGETSSAASAGEQQRQEDEVDRLRAAVAQLTGQVEVQAVALQAAQAERSQLQEEVSGLSMRVGALARQVEEKEREARGAREEAEEAQRVCAQKSEEASAAVARAERAEGECSEARTRAVSLVAQASAAQLAQQDVRRQLAVERAEVTKLKATLAGAGCDRCRHFDLPELEGAAPSGDEAEGAAGVKEREEYHAALRTVAKQGQWFSVDAVKGALAEAMSLRLVVLAPTVKINLSMQGQGQGGGGQGGKGGMQGDAGAAEETEGRDAAVARLDALAGVPVSSLVRTLEEEVMPRFACVLTVPRLRLKAPPATTATAPVPIPAGLSSQASLDAWLKAMVKQMEGEVQEALAGSGLFKAGGAGGTTYTTGSAVQ